MTKFCIFGMFILFFTACAEEAQPYEEVNSTLSSQETGQIQTH